MAESTPDAAGRQGRTSEPDWKRKRRLAEIFGDVLPGTTGDERGPDGSAPRSEEAAEDAWLRSQVPPHHGNV